MRDIVARNPRISGKNLAPRPWSGLALTLRDSGKNAQVVADNYNPMAAGKISGRNSCTL
jgi:hypothetical protein